MKKRELMGIVSKVLGLYFGVVGFQQLLSLFPMLSQAFKPWDNLSDIIYFLIIVLLMVVYYFVILWLLVAKTEKISKFLIKDNENSDVNIGIGKDGLQQFVFFAAGVYLFLSIVPIVASAVALFFSYPAGVRGNIISSVVKVLIGAALIIFCGPISRFTDKLSERFK